MQVEFGFLPKRLDIQGAGWSIATLPQFDEAMSRCVNNPNVKDGWMFSNLDPLSHYSTARLFNLPKTHSISHQSGDVDRITFILWVLSFLNGIRLSSRPNGFVDSTPVETGKLVDFILRGNIERPVELAESFWQSNFSNPIQCKRFAAAVHVHFMSKGPRLFQFERFIYQYTALDACFALMSEGQSVQIPSHAGRLKWMCEHSGVPIPKWATLVSSKESELSVLRNFAIHEGLFAGEPLGFALADNSDTRNLSWEMGCLTCRLLVSILGISDQKYISMPTDIYASQGLIL